jgi:hypothetical protein
LFHHSRTIATTCIAGAFFLFVSGCSEPTGTISGKVTYKDAPVTTGSITFLMKSKGNAQEAKLDATGTYTMATPMPAGTYQAFYTPPPPEPQDPSKGGRPAVVKSAVPAKYQSPETSQLSFEVKSGKNDIPIAIKD